LDSAQCFRRCDTLTAASGALLGQYSDPVIVDDERERVGAIQEFQGVFDTAPHQIQLAASHRPAAVNHKRHINRLTLVRLAAWLGGLHRRQNVEQSRVQRTEGRLEASAEFESCFTVRIILH
jgi:hypothetical protein